MIFICKREEPVEFAEWKRDWPEAHYSDLSGKPRKALRKALVQEQGGVCCFCGIRIFFEERTTAQSSNTRIAHIVPQSVDPSRELDYGNMCASCNTQLRTPAGGVQESHCDEHQGSKELPVTPLMPDCLSFFTCYEDGMLAPHPMKNVGEQAMAAKTIAILNLNSNILVLRRKKVIDIVRNTMRSGSSASEACSAYERRRSDLHEEFYFIPRLALME